MASSTDSGYRGEIDGLRGISILAVLLNHADSGILSGGYVGVDVFFVISGFLITAIIRRDLTSGRFSFWHFYARRAKRLLPAATAMVLATMVLGYLFFLPSDFHRLGKSVVAYSAMLSNVFFSRQSAGYWDDQAKSWPLLHTWSLAVEEQFYLAYPLLLYAMRRCSLRRQLLVLITVLISSFAISVYQTTVSPRAAYYLMLGRVWELLLGAICSLVAPPKLGRNTCELLGLFAVGSVGVPMFVFSDSTPFPGWLAAFPATGTAILLWITQDGSSIWKTLLAWRPLVAIGRISYSLYLFHWPMIVFARYLWGGPTETPSVTASYSAAAASLLVAGLSYRYIENPGRCSRIGDKAALALALCCAVFVLFTGVVVYRGQGLPERLPPLVARYAEASSDRNPRRVESDLTNAMIKAGQVGHLGAKGQPEFVLWGDSHADALVPVFDSLARDYGIAGMAVARGDNCPLLGVETTGKGFDPDFAPTVLDRLREERIPCVILAARWGYHLDGLSENKRPVKDPGRRVELFREGLTKTIAQLRMSGVEQIWIVRQVPAQTHDVPRQLALSAWWGRYLPIATPRPVTREDYDAQMQGVESAMNSVAAPDVAIIDPTSAIFANKNGLLTEGGQPLYFDDDHLSTSGALSIAAVFQPIFDRIVQRSAAKATR